MENIQINYNENSFTDRPIILAQNGEIKATAFKYSTGVCALKLENEKCSMVLLPYHGHQIWKANFNGKNLTQKSIFDEPLKTTKFGDNYGALLIHCGLSAMGNPSDNDSHPLHGELPTALYTNNYIRFDKDDDGEFMAVGGTFHYRNAQDFNYIYAPELRMYQNSSVLKMSVNIENLRCSPMEYMCMYHVNWRAVEGSKIVCSVPPDSKHIFVDEVEPNHDSARGSALYEFSKKFIANPEIGDVLDSKTQVFNPEYCVDMRYIGDENNWAHAMQVMPDGDACYIGWRRDEMPNGLRWYCRTGDEDGLGFALPTTGNHMGYIYQKQQEMYNVIDAYGKGSIQFDFGYLNKEEAIKTEEHINKILREYK